MPEIKLITEVNAPLDVCFDLSLSIDFHMYCLRHTGESAVGTKTTGVLALDEEVTWRATHFVQQELTSRITMYDRPRHFRDSMVRGAFKRFDHDHFFKAATPTLTVITDVFDFDSPLGFLGQIANEIFLTKYMTRLLEEKNRLFKESAELPEQRARFLT